MRAGGSSDPYYDLFEDYDLIVSSFLAQYGLRLQTEEFQTVCWSEFKALLSGISPETPLGRIAAIRSETDKKAIRNFSREQRRIYDAWRDRKARRMDSCTYEQEMASLERMFEQLCRQG